MTSLGPADFTPVAQLEEWMRAMEGENLEFKEAKNRYSFEDLTKYCCALANEGGGRVVLGVTNLRPRSVVGTEAFPQPEETRRSLMERLPLRIGVQEIRHPAGRVLVFEIPPRPVGTPIQYDGRYWCRQGDSLATMSERALRNVFAESGHDFSADVCPAADLSHLDARAIEDFRRRWLGKSKGEALTRMPHDQLLRDAEVLTDAGVTYAGLVLFGTRAALGRFLGQAEVVFEYRSSDASGPAQERKEYRQGFFSFYDELWRDIEKRNDIQHYQEGLFVLDIPTFDERAVREAVLNAVSHRDYQLGGSVFVRQYRRRLVVESPGGLPVGITTANILDRQSPRNRRIADVLSKCGLVERSGQGMNLIYERSIRQGKPRPDLTGTDAYHVVVALEGEVSDPRFVQFLEKVGQERLASFATQDFLVLDLVHSEQHIPPELRPRLGPLRELGIIESVGRGRGARYLLSRRFQAALGRRGAHTRKRGLDREQNKVLLVNHIRETGTAGCPISELEQVLPALSRDQIKRLLYELKSAGLLRLAGARRGARWVAPEES